MLAGEPALGVWLAMGSPIAAEIVANAGYDTVIMDHEHGPGDLLNAIGLMQAAASSGATPMMRVPWNDMVYIKRALDIGVMGIVVPYVQNAAEAEAAVAACRYPTVGVRGVAPHAGALLALGLADQGLSRGDAAGDPCRLPDRDRGSDRQYRGDRGGRRRRHAVPRAERRLGEHRPHA